MSAEWEEEEQEFTYSADEIEGDDEDDVDWEEVAEEEEDDTIEEQEVEDDEEEKTEAAPVDWDKLNQVLYQELTPSGKKKRKVVNRMTRVEKEHEETLHRSHLLLLLSTQLKWNALCQSPLLRGLMLSLTAGQDACDFFADVHMHPLTYSLELLLRWFRQEFHVITTASIENADTVMHSESFYTNASIEETVTEAKLMEVFFARKGTNYELALLFTLLCRALQLQCRHVCSLDPYLVRHKTTKALESSLTQQGKLQRTDSRKRRRSLTKNATDENIATFEAGQSFWVWCEAFDKKRNSWIPVDALHRLVNRPQEMEALKGKSTPFSYVVSIGEQGTLLDVTPRYASRWSKTLEFRLADNWMQQMIEKINESNINVVITADSGISKQQTNRKEKELEYIAAERAKLQSMIETEDMPTSLEGFKKHHVYCLEVHLGQYECIYPRKAVGLFKGQPVFLRKNVQVTRPAFKWLRLGREVRDAERPTPVRWKGKAKKSTQARHHEFDGDDSYANDNEGESGSFALYGLWQTDPFVPAKVVNGKVPKNKYGNIEIWSDAHIPRGAMHLRLPRIQKVAEELGIDYAPAVVGFEMKNGKTYPQIDGIVIAKSVEEMLVDAHAHVQQSTIEKAIHKNQQIILKRWERLVKRLLLRQRLEDDYGAIQKEN